MSDEIQMWWCCGKQGKEQPGCKWSKHESKDDEDEEENEQEANKEKNNKYVRCMCCKELGHTIDMCMRDPNLKSGAKAEDEWLRIQKLKDYRKLFADSIVQTTQMLKKSVMIPIKTDQEGVVEEVPHAYNPFMRGVMEFDDFNYTLHNPYILIEDPRYADEPSPKADDKKSKTAAPLKLSISKPPTAAGGSEGEPTFSQKNIDISVVEDYEHELILIHPSEMELEKQRI